MGQVVNPGVYEVRGDKLVIEAIELAGGYSKEVDLVYVHKNISLSSKVKPTQKIYIPAIGEENIPNNLTSSGISNGKINLNTADKNTLMTISGVGEVTAQKIIEIRPLKSIEELNTLSGVPKKTIDNIIAKSEL
jgi:competence protein ComEA